MSWWFYAMSTVGVVESEGEAVVSWGGTQLSQDEDSGEESRLVVDETVAGTVDVV